MTTVQADIDQLTKRLLAAETSVIAERSGSIKEDTDRVHRQIIGWRARYGLEPLSHPHEGYYSEDE